MSRGIAIFKVTGLVGGGVDKLDGIDGAAGGPNNSPLQQGDIAFVVDATANISMMYELDADSGATENSPEIISPDTNPGDKRWLLKKIKHLAAAMADSLTMSGVNPLTINGVAGGNTPVGAGMDWYTNTPPAGWLICDGSAISRTTYSALFAVIGTTFGSGNGSTTFNLPDFRGRVGVGRKTSDSDFDGLGETGGEKAHELTELELPVVDLDGYGVQAGGPWYYAGGGAEITARFREELPSFGGGYPHNNLQPYLVVNKIIKY